MRIFEAVSDKFNLHRNCTCANSPSETQNNKTEVFIFQGLILPWNVESAMKQREANLSWERANTCLFNLSHLITRSAIESVSLIHNGRRYIACHCCFIDRLCVDSDVSLVETTRFRSCGKHCQNNRKSILGSTKKVKSTKGLLANKGGFQPFRSWFLFT
jgi:hypothetical protein